MINQLRSVFSLLLFIFFLQHNTFANAETGLIGYWPMDEASGSIITDVSGNGLDASLNNDDEATHVSGKLNNALYFDGTRDGTIVSANALKPESLTIAAYINIPFTSNTRQWIGGLGDNYGLVVNRDGDIHFYYYNGSSWPNITIDVDDLRDGQWHHIAGAFDVSTGQLQAFVDGVLVGSRSGNGDIVYSKGNDFHIGSMNGERHFNGNMDELKVYDRALTEAEVAPVSVITPTHLLPDNKWHQISLPMNPGSNNTVDDIFGDDELGTYDTDWVIFSYDTVADNYIKLTTDAALSQGLGYWIIQTTGSDKVLDMPATESTITPTTNPTGCASGECFQIPLGSKEGDNQWNMIGYPFSVSGLLSNSRIVTTASTDKGCESGCVLQDAKSDNVFHDELWSYDGDVYIVLNDSSTIDPWMGFWSATLNGASGKEPSLLLSKKTVTFPVPTYTLTTDTVGSGSITLSPSGGSYSEGTVVSVNAVADVGFVFSGWSGDLSGGNASQSLTMNADKTITATFIEGTTFTLDTNTLGSGSVSLSPSGSNYEEGTVVNLTAIASAGHIFTGWSGDLSGSSNPQSLVMDSNKSVTASFIEDSGLIAYWPMDEISGSIIADVSGNGLDATLNNIDETTHISGKLNNALNFDSTRDGTIVSANALKPESLTIAAYINIPSASGAWQWVGGHGDNYGLVVNKDGDIQFYYYNGSSWPKITIDVEDLRDGEWHHIAGSFDESTGQLQAFVDGVLVGSRSGSGDIVYSKGNDFHIGSMNGTRRFNGDIDELKVYDRALTETEVTGLLVSEIVYANVIRGAVFETDAGTKQAAVNITLSRQSTFDVSMDYITVPNSATDGDDYQGVSGSLVIPAGSLTATVLIDVFGDTNIELDEDFYLQISNVIGAEAGVTQASYNIRNDDGVQYGLSSRPSNLECVAGDRPSFGTDSLSLSMENAFPSITFTNPVAMEQVPGDDTRYYVVEVGGKIKVIENGVLQSAPFLDISNNIGSRKEDGLYSIAFHPNYASNGLFYISYVDAGSWTQIDRYKVSDNPNIADASSEVTILERAQPYKFHNNYHIAFGEDGYLYIAMGDGGSSRDPDANAQDTSTWLGSMLRIDVDSGTPYSIPPDNPFAGQSCNQTTRTGNCPEIYAWGLRSPWRWSFDRQTQDLWLGDVGQSTVEEVNIIEKGKNYGWKCYEGEGATTASGCSGVTNINPIDSYRHRDGACAVTGGFVYRGDSILALKGTYLYGDLCTGNVYGLPYYTEPTANSTIMFNSASFLVSFAQDNAGELYIISYNDGTISEIISTNGGSVSNPNVPKLLSESSCVAIGAPSQPISSMIPFKVNAPHWADRAHNENWLAIPDGSKIDHQQGGDWIFPTGSVIMKNFILDDSLIETRFMMRHNDGGWGGYTYEWNDAGTDANLVLGGKEKDINGQMWIYPSAAECAACHTKAAGGALAPETVQLNGIFTYPQTGIVANQLESMEKVGMFTEIFPSSPEGLGRLVNPYDNTEDLENRAKSWLHTNCSSCHQPGVVTQINIDFRYSTPLGDMNICNVPPENEAWGLTNPMRLTPGDASQSLIFNRPGRLDEGQMPPIGTNLIDTEGLLLIQDWINNLVGCP